MPSHTPEQLAIIAAARDTDDNLIVDAKAGSGKTFTLLELLPTLRGTTQLQAFNKSIATELQQRAKRKLTFEQRLNVSIGTCHSFGLAAYRKNSNMGRKLQINGGKLAFLYKDLFLKGASPEQFRKLSKISYTIRQFVSAAKNSGIGLVSGHEFFPDISDRNAWASLAEHFSLDLALEKEGILLDRGIDMAMRLLALNNATRGMIDFDDMIYFPLLDDISLPSYHNVLIDEAQDISATRRELAFRSLAKSGRIIAVGDPNQAIYGFTGADAASLPNIAARAKNRGPTTHLSLSICFRCDERIIREAQRKVPAIQPRPAAPPGVVDSITLEDDFSALAAAVEPGSAILCRLNRPNVAAALALLSANKQCKIEGRDLGQRLLSHLKKASPAHAVQPLSRTRLETEIWGEEEVAMLAAAGRGGQAALLVDELEALMLLIDKCLSEGQTRYTDLENLIKTLFADDIPPSRIITLSSVHKAKGREWPRVFILGRRDYMPFFLAEQDWELEQEDNLIYVAITRAEHHLTYVHGVKSILDKRANSFKGDNV